MVESPLIDSLRRAVAEAPDDVPLRVHLAELLLDDGRVDDAVGHLASAMRLDPASAPARALMARALAADAPSPTPPSPPGPAAGPAGTTPGDRDHPPSPSGRAGAPATPAGPLDSPVPPSGRAGAPATPAGPPTPPSVPGPPVSPSAGVGPPDVPPPTPGDAGFVHPSGAVVPGGFDWGRAEAELGDVAPPMFVDGDGGVRPDAGEVGRSRVRLADVGGMAGVKQRLEAAFLAPLRNPELRRAYAKSLRGGLLLYGPPGCGKTFLARAVAGELGAAFVTVSLADVLDMYVGQSERNLHDFFDLARRSAPCVVFLDEVDAIGQKRTHLRHSAMRSTVNQLLHELDGVGDDNDGVFILAATNAPWDVDPALRRPGRLDRTLLVLPPDAAAREEILRYHLRDRPVAGIDLRKAAKATDGFSGADLAHLCDAAAERALLESARTGDVRLIGMADLDAARREVRASTGPWFETARNVALFANEGGQYDDLLAYMKKHRLA